MRTLMRVAAIALAALGCAASALVSVPVSAPVSARVSVPVLAPDHQPAPAASAAAHQRWTGCPAGYPGPGVQQGPLDGSATRLPRLGDDFSPVAVIVCVEASESRPDGGRDLVSTEYRGVDITELMAALRLPDEPANTEQCSSDPPFPRWFALLDAQGRWARPGTPKDGCGDTRPEVLDVVARLSLTVTRRHPLRELESAQAAAAGCQQLSSDRVAQFSKPDSPGLEAQPVPFTFGGPVRLCVYRVFADQPAGGLADFVRGGVLPPDRWTAAQQHLQAPKPGAPCADRSTLFAQLTNAEHPFRDGYVWVQFDGCRQMLLEPPYESITLARGEPALIALMSLK